MLELKKHFDANNFDLIILVNNKNNNGLTSTSVTSASTSVTSASTSASDSSSDSTTDLDNESQVTTNSNQFNNLDENDNISCSQSSSSSQISIVSSNGINLSNKRLASGREVGRTRKKTTKLDHKSGEILKYSYVNNSNKNNNSDEDVLKDFKKICDRRLYAFLKVTLINTDNLHNIIIDKLEIKEENILVDSSELTTESFFL
jgi:hypothetical protein